MMRINNNVMAMNAHRYLSSAGVRQSKSLEKISSGLRINSAADDAAGLAISEKMRAQISGLEQAETNAQNGISLIQTAEGALNETHSILQRMRQLAVNSSNDTNTETDRAEIQKEIDELATELSRISDTTEFNTENLLNGKFDATFHIGANAGQEMKLSISDMSADNLGVTGDEGIEIEVDAMSSNWVAANAAIKDGEEYEVTKFDKIEGVGGNPDDIEGVDAEYGLADKDGKIVAISSNGIKFTALETATELDELDGDTVFANDQDESNPAKLDDLDFADKVKGTVTATLNNDDNKMKLEGKSTIEFAGKEKLATGDYTVAAAAGFSDFENINAGELVLLNEDKEIVAVTTVSDDSADQVWKVNDNKTDDERTVLFTFSKGNGFKADDTIKVSSDGGIDVSDQAAASNAITVLEDAISTVSSERSKLGAYQNRLEHTINNLSTTTENLQASESRIRDVDVAKEMMEFTKLNILSQASQSMLAQANQVPQGVLQLLG